MPKVWDDPLLHCRQLPYRLWVAASPKTCPLQQGTRRGWRIQQQLLLLQAARCSGKVSSCGRPSCCYSYRRCYLELLTHCSLLASSGLEAPSAAERSGLPSGATGRQETPLRSSQQRSLRRTGSHIGERVPARHLRIFACEHKIGLAATESTISNSLPHQ